MIKFETWSSCFISISMIRMQTLQQKTRARQSSNITATALATSTWDFLGIQIRNLKHQHSTSQIIRHYAATNQTATVAPMVQELSAITDYRFHQGIQGEWVYATTAVLETWQRVLLRAPLRATAVSSHSDLLFTCTQPLVSTGSATETHKVFSICVNTRSTLCQNKKQKCPKTVLLPSSQKLLCGNYIIVKQKEKNVGRLVIGDPKLYYVIFWFTS